MSTGGARGQTWVSVLWKACDALEDAHRGLVPGGLGRWPYRKEKRTIEGASVAVSDPMARSISARHVRRQPTMPPRPRPKPKVRSGNDSQSLKETPPSRDEEDSIFIKSGNLTTATWKQMNQIPSGVFPHIGACPRLMSSQCASHTRNTTLEMTKVHANPRKCPAERRRSPSSTHPNSYQISCQCLIVHL